MGDVHVGVYFDECEALSASIWTSEMFPMEQRIQVLDKWLYGMRTRLVGEGPTSMRAITIPPCNQSKLYIGLTLRDEIW